MTASKNIKKNIDKNIFVWYNNDIKDLVVQGQTLNSQKKPPMAVGGLFLGCRCLLLLLSTVQPFAYVVIENICGYFCSNSDKKGFNEIKHCLHHLSAEAWGVGNINIIAHFAVFCQ